jgi:hypothetical protein
MKPTSNPDQIALRPLNLCGMPLAEPFYWCTNDQLCINHLDALCRAMSTEEIQIGNVMEQDFCVNKLIPG